MSDAFILKPWWHLALFEYSNSLTALPDKQMRTFSLIQQDSNLIGEIIPPWLLLFKYPILITLNITYTLINKSRMFSVSWNKLADQCLEPSCMIFFFFSLPVSVYANLVGKYGETVEVPCNKKGDIKLEDIRITKWKYVSTSPAYLVLSNLYGLWWVRK